MLKTFITGSCLVNTSLMFSHEGSWLAHSVLRCSDGSAATVTLKCWVSRIPWRHCSNRSVYSVNVSDFSWCQGHRCYDTGVVCCPYFWWKELLSFSWRLVRISFFFFFLIGIQKLVGQKVMSVLVKVRTF